MCNKFDGFPSGNVIVSSVDLELCIFNSPNAKFSYARGLATPQKHIPIYLN